jgi:hypothetical protein
MMSMAFEKKFEKTIEEFSVLKWFLPINAGDRHSISAACQVIAVLFFAQIYAFFGVLLEARLRLGRLPCHPLDPKRSSWGWSSARSVALEEVVQV